MPSGKTHAQTSGYLSLTLLSGIVYFPLESILMALGCFLGVFLTPDLDVDRGNYGYFVIRTVWGRRASGLWEAYWHRYAVTIRHRHWISHSILISTFIRIFYLFWPLFILLWFFGHGTTIIQENAYVFSYIFLGLVVSDSAHIIMDRTSTWFKRRF